MSRRFSAVLPLLLVACDQNSVTTEDAIKMDNSVAMERGDVMDAQVLAVNTAAPAAMESLSLPKSRSVIVTALPLKHGYYVASGTPCDQASNATVSLLRREGIGGSRDFCEFKRIEKVGANSYRVAQACGGGQDSAASETIIAIYTLTDDIAFTSRSTSGREYSARYCDQSTMPPDWRANDISEETD